MSETTEKILSAAVLILSNKNVNVQNTWFSCIQQLNEQNVIKIIGVWGYLASISNAVRLKYFPTAQLYAGKGDEPHALLKDIPTLANLVELTNDVVASFIIIDPSNENLEEFLSFYTGPRSLPKHIFLCQPSSFRSSFLKDYCNSVTRDVLQKGQGKVISCVQPFTQEPAVTALINMLPELGPLVGARFFENLLTEEGSLPEDILTECCTHMCSLLVHIFGNVHSVSGMINQELKEAFLDKNKHLSSKLNGLAYSCWMKFTENLSCSIFLITSSQDFALELVVWGVRGMASLNWDATQKYFRVQRNLQNFEHPLLLPAMGNALSLYIWVEACLKNEIEPSTEHNALTIQSLFNQSLANSLLTSEGKVITCNLTSKCFGKTPLSSFPSFKTNKNGSK